MYKTSNKVQYYWDSDHRLTYVKDKGCFGPMAYSLIAVPVFISAVIYLLGFHVPVVIVAALLLLFFHFCVLSPIICLKHSKCNLVHPLTFRHVNTTRYFRTVGPQEKYMSHTIYKQAVEDFVDEAYEANKLDPEIYEIPYDLWKETFSKLDIAMGERTKLLKEQARRDQIHTYADALEIENETLRGGS